jgi:hypothetical protein
MVILGHNFGHMHNYFNRKIFHKGDLLSIEYVFYSKASNYAVKVLSQKLTLHNAVSLSAENVK